MVIHSCDGLAAKPCLDACFPSREPHLLLGISGLAPVDNVEETRAAEEWVHQVAGDITKVGLAMEFEYQLCLAREE